MDEATTGSLSGRVTFEGTPPPADILRMGTDPACVIDGDSAPESRAVLVDAAGGLQNAFVHISDGLDPDYSFEIPTTAVILDQVGCRYTPRVLGVRAGQPMEIVNSDETFHNVHALPMTNVEFNHGQPNQGDRMTHIFTVPEVMVRFKCNVHSWMTAHIGVMAHPFFATTAPDGSFDITGIPPGTYTVEVWHERFGTQTQSVTIAEQQAATTTFTFANGG